MGKELPYILQFYDNEVSLLISNKYGYPIMDSYRKFLFSKTYQMLCNPELEMYSRRAASQVSESMEPILSSSRLIFALVSADVAVSKRPSKTIVAPSSSVRKVVVIKVLSKCFRMAKLRISERNAKEKLVFYFHFRTRVTKTAGQSYE